MQALKTLRDLWARFGSNPIGRKLMSRALGLAVPYSGSIGAEILELDKYSCRIQMKDRRAVRNHLNSVHALALANLGEMASGLALNVWMPDSLQAIVTNLNIEFIKKARGSIVATSKVSPPEEGNESIQVVTSELFDSQNQKVAEVKVTWLIRPKKP